VDADIKGKIAAGNRCYRSFSKILGTRYITKNTKIRIYKTFIRPVVLYGSETWAITGKMASSLMTLRWLDDVEDDIKALGIRQWRIKAQDRYEWTVIKREAKVKLKGP
jgi:hypothetical protein